MLPGRRWILGSHEGQDALGCEGDCHHNGSQAARLALAHPPVLDSCSSGPHAAGYSPSSSSSKHPAPAGVPRPSFLTASLSSLLSSDVPAGPPSSRRNQLRARSGRELAPLPQPSRDKTSWHALGVLLLSWLSACQAIPHEALAWYPKNHTEKMRVFVSHETWPEAHKRAGFSFPRLDARMADGDEVKLRSVHDTWMMFTDNKRWTLRGRTIELQAPTGLYCTVNLDDSKSMLRCQDREPAFSGWLEVNGDGGHSTLKDARKNMYCSDHKDGIRCISDQRHHWELFEIDDCPTDPERLVLRGGRTHHYCKDYGTDGVRCTRSQLDDATCFLPVAGEPFTTRIIQTQDESKAAVFQIERQGNRDPKFRCKGKPGFLVVESNSHTLTCAELGGLHISPERVKWWSSYQANIKVKSLGKWLQAGDDKDSDLQIRASSSDGGGWALWKVKLIGGYEVIRPLIRGVNLGNWLLLEKWMEPHMFVDSDGKEFDGKCPPLDERGLLEHLDHETKTRRLLHHWKTYITEEDIKWLSEHQITAVRLPFGYWAMRPDFPFIFGQQEYIDKLFDWCEKYDISILLDFHGLKGSQTGSPTSGNCGACGQDQCGTTWVHFLKDSDFNLQIIRDMVDRYSHRSAYLGFEIANEVAGSLKGEDVMDFYQKAYEIIRSKNPDAMIVIYATFNPSTYPFKDFNNVFVDQHIYFGMGLGAPTTDQHDNLKKAERAVHGRSWSLLVGEWSMGASGEITNGWSKEREADFYLNYARMQLQAYEKHTIGWFYWSYKTFYPGSTWNYRDMVEKGWIPGQPGNIFASSEWWRLPECVYDYLDGPCGLAAEEEFAEKNFGEPMYQGFSTEPTEEKQFTSIFRALGIFILLMGPIGGSVVILRLLNPPWWRKFEDWVEGKWTSLRSLYSTHRPLRQDLPEDRVAFAKSIADALESPSPTGRA